MKNKEKFAKEIIEIAKKGSLVRVNKETGLPEECTYINRCRDCLFHINNKPCPEERKRWFEEDPSEIMKAKIELRSIDSIKENYKYIAKDPDGCLVVSETPLYKNRGNLYWTCYPSFKVDYIKALKGSFDMLNNLDEKCRLIEDIKKELIKKIGEEKED